MLPVVYESKFSDKISTSLQLVVNDPAEFQPLMSDTLQADLTQTKYVVSAFKLEIEVVVVKITVIFAGVAVVGAVFTVL